MNTVAIVGFGWFGLPLAEYLSKKGYRVKGTCTSTEKTFRLREQGFDTAVLDLNKPVDAAELRAFFSEAAYCVINIPPSKSLFQTYQNQCESLVHLFPNSTKFIFISSTSVYSENIGEALEDTKVLTHYDFASQLYLTEKKMQHLLGERLSILRFAGLFGPGRNLAKFFAGKKELANGLGPINLLCLDDAIQSVFLTLENQLWGELVNICSSEHISREEHYTQWCKDLKLEVPTFKQEMLTNKIVSNEKGKRLLGLKYSCDNPSAFYRT